MKEMNTKRISSNSFPKPGKNERRDPKHGNARKPTKPRGANTKAALSSKTGFNKLGSSSSRGAAEPSEVYERVVVHYMDDISGVMEEPDLVVQEVRRGVGNDSLSFPECQNEETDSEVGQKRAGKHLSYSRDLSSRAKSERRMNYHSGTTAEEMEHNRELLGKETVMIARDFSKLEAKSFIGANEKISFDELSNGTRSFGSDEETANTECNEREEKTDPYQKIKKLEQRIGRLEDELREVAALEVSLYSAVPEHCSSPHKLHTPARRLSELYIQVCERWSQHNRATLATSTVSGLVMIAKSCGNDVSRLSFWLSNTIILRETIAQLFGGGRRHEMRTSALKLKGGFDSKLTNKNDYSQFIGDWHETRTLTTTLLKVESWIFSRIVESVWWQTMAPNMQSPIGDSNAKIASEKVQGPSLGDHQQGEFSISLWKNAFQDALGRLCPVRSSGHKCGCLSILTQKVMEQSICRLDVAMFNALLRESANEIPSDPISDPIVNAKVLPISSRDLSFGSGAQLKNSIGKLTKWLNDNLPMEAKDGPKYFPLLNSLGDLLMLPKHLLVDPSIRDEVCPSISLPLVRRILCKFTPDEFCPGPVPLSVWETLDAEEDAIEQREEVGVVGSYPQTAPPVTYTPPSSSIVMEKIRELSHSHRNGKKNNLSSSATRNRGCSSEDEDETDYPLPLSIIGKLSLSQPRVAMAGNRSVKLLQVGAFARYELLGDVRLA